MPNFPLALTGTDGLSLSDAPREFITIDFFRIKCQFALKLSHKHLCLSLHSLRNRP